MNTAPPRSESVKDILRAAHLLLQPPEAVPSDATELQKRIAASWAYLPHEWQLTTDPGSIPAAGDSDARNGGELADGVEELKTPGVKVAEQMDQRAEVVERFRRRCLDLLLGLQAVLRKEYWPAQARQGYEARDFLLGTADLRLIRALIAQSLVLLKGQSEVYLVSLRSGTGLAGAAPSLLESISTTMLGLLRLSEQPPSSSTDRAGPSEPRHQPPTTITQLLLNSHLSAILSSAILLGYNPTCPPETHASTRKAILSMLALLQPAQCLSALSGVLALASAGRYPAYVAQVAQRRMSAQLFRPNGVQGLLLNLFGERARSAAAGADAEGIDQKKVDHAVAVLCRVPGGLRQDEYVRHVMRECLAIMGVPAPGQGQAPRVFRMVVAAVIQRLAEGSEEARGVIFEALEPIRTTSEQDGTGIESDQAANARWSALELVDTMIAYTDPAYLPAFLDTFVRPLLPSLAELYDRDASSDQGKTTRAMEPAAAERIQELAGDALSTWKRVIRSQSSASTAQGDTVIGPDPVEEGVARALAKLRIPREDDDGDPGTASARQDAPAELAQIQIALSSANPPIRVQALDRLQGYSSPTTIDETLPLFIAATEEDEPFVHLKAISCLSDLTDQHGRAVLLSLVQAYLGRLDEVVNASGTSKAAPQAKALRLAEALVGAVRRVEPDDRPTEDLLLIKGRLGEMLQAGDTSDTMRTSMATLRRYL